MLSTICIANSAVVSEKSVGLWKKKKKNYRCDGAVADYVDGGAAAIHEPVEGKHHGHQCGSLQGVVLDVGGLHDLHQNRNFFKGI